MAINAKKTDVIVVGGGLSGLTTACFLGRAGFGVRVLEKAGAPGGRAATDAEHGFLLNRGPHALYDAGEAARTLRELGVPYSAGAAPRSGWVLSDGALHRLPLGSGSLLATGLLGVAAKVEAARWLSVIPRLRPEEQDGASVNEWLARGGASDDVTALIRALVRLSTYANAPESFSAGTAIRQLHKAYRGVSYVDGGWQSLVDGLRVRAEASGVEVVCSARAESLRAADGGFSVGLSDGREMRSRSVVLAGSRSEADRLLGAAGVHLPHDPAPPIRMATLDLALASLPRPAWRFVIGIDRPLYLSVHSGVARLGARGAVLHVARYLPTGETDPARDRAEIEELLDLAQPGWRKELVTARFLPRLTVAERLDAAASGGHAGRPDFRVPELPGVYVAGDWVRGGSWLADAAMGSARHVALAVAARGSGEKAVA